MRAETSKTPRPGCGGSPGAFSVAILADLHGNVAALEAVLADLTARPADRVVVAGDLAVFGPRPAETLGRVRGLGAETILGNTDRDVVRARGRHPGLAWTARRLGDDGLAWIDALPFDVRLTPPGAASPAGDLLVVHATPTDLEGLLVLEPCPAAGWPLTPPDEAESRVGDAKAGLIAYGHIHYASRGEVAGRRLASVGSVGFPFDGDPRAAYAVARWDGRAWSVEDRRVAYDHEAVARELDAIDAPFAATCAARIREARPVPFPRWIVWRQDDQGNRFEVVRLASEDSARRLVEEYEARGREQTYWFERS